MRAATATSMSNLFCILLQLWMKSLRCIPIAAAASIMAGNGSADTGASCGPSTGWLFSCSDAVSSADGRYAMGTSSDDSDSDGRTYPPFCCTDPASVSFASRSFASEGGIHFRSRDTSMTNSSVVATSLPLPRKYAAAQMSISSFMRPASREK